MPTLEEAVRIAAEAHAGQRDRYGAPYLLHPLRVMLRMRTDAERMAAVLHDVVEDTEWTLERLRAAGFPAEVVSAVDAVTRREGEDYDAFVRRAARDPIGRAVKLADVEDNLDLRRVDEVLPRDVERLNRYLRAWRHLAAAGDDAGT